MDLSAEKAAARVSVKERIARLIPEQREAESRSISRRIFENLPPAPIEICVYSAVPQEASLAFLLPLLWERGDTVFLPRFSNNALTFGKIEEDTTLLKGQLGILEPPMGSDAPSLEGIHLVITPGLAFDRSGNRLGRGNGGYDKWFEKLKAVNDHVKLWGVALDCQLLREVPHDAKDQTMDAIATPRELIKVTK